MRGLGVMHGQCMKQRTASTKTQLRWLAAAEWSWVIAFAAAAALARTSEALPILMLLLPLGVSVAAHKRGAYQDDPQRGLDEGGPVA
jgi:hypothetical protein